MKMKGQIALVSTTCSTESFGISLSLRYEYNYCLHNVNNHMHTYGWETIRPKNCFVPFEMPSQSVLDFNHSKSCDQSAISRAVLCYHLEGM